MSKINYSPKSLDDLNRIRVFLANKNQTAAKKAIQAIVDGIKELTHMPHVGKPVENTLLIRDWMIDFGKSGYVVRYHYDGEMIFVLAVRHQKEAGF